MQKKLKESLFIGSLIAASPIAAQANSLVTGKVAVPRGYEIQVQAGNCGIGPFPQTSKAGIYNDYCDILSDAEKCTAFIKGHLLRNGEAVKTSEPKKLQYCLDQLQEELLDLGEELD